MSILINACTQVARLEWGMLWLLYSQRLIAQYLA
jgi:hypothetical protein